MSVTQKPSRLRWLWLIPVGLLIVGLVVCFVWWQYFKTTPAYTLALLVDAAQQNDRAGFDRVVDLNRVIDNFIAEGAQDSAIGLSTELVTSVRMQLQTLAPETTAGIKESVKEEIQNRINELAGSSGARPFVLTALAMPFVSEINQNVDEAQVKMNRIDEVELLMDRREGSNWKVTSLRDRALAARVVSIIVKNLPRSGSQIEEQLRRQLRGLPETLPKLPLLSDR
jgi:hypothetical protein